MRWCMVAARTQCRITSPRAARSAALRFVPMLARCVSCTSLTVKASCSLRMP